MDPEGVRGDGWIGRGVGGQLNNHHFDSVQIEYRITLKYSHASLFTANSKDLDQTPRSATSDQGLYCLLRSFCSNTVLSTSLGKTFFAWRFILNENILL